MRANAAYERSLVLASAIAVLFGAYEQDGAHFLFSIPEIDFEFSITIYTLVKGFRPSPILDDTRYPRVGEGSGCAAPAPSNRRNGKGRTRDAARRDTDPVRTFALQHAGVSARPPETLVRDECSSEGGVTREACSSSRGRQSEAGLETPK